MINNGNNSLNKINFAIRNTNYAYTLELIGTNDTLAAKAIHLEE